MSDAPTSVRGTSGNWAPRSAWECGDDPAPTAAPVDDKPAVELATDVRDDCGRPSPSVPCELCGQVHPGGRFVRGCPGPRLRTGERSRLVQEALLPQQADAFAALEERRTEIEHDLGGPAELSRFERDMVTSYQRLGLIEDFAFQIVQSAGVFTTKGRQRSAVSTMQKVIAQRTDIAKTLGLKRRTRRVPSLAEVLRDE